MPSHSKFTNAQLIDVFFKSNDEIHAELLQREEDIKKGRPVPSEIYFVCKFCPEGSQGKKCSNIRSIANLAAHAKVHPDCDEIVENKLKLFDDLSQPRISSAFPSTISEEARDLFSWADFIVGAYLPFCVVEDPLYRKNIKMKRNFGKKYFMEMLEAIGDSVCKSIAKLLPDHIGIVFDDWTAPGVSEHYCAIFATFWNGSKVEKLFLSMAPMLKPENEDEADFGAEAHVAYFRDILQMYGKTLKSVDFLVGDNCSVNKKIARLMKIPLIGCALHRLNLAVEKLFETEEIATLLKIVKEFMSGLRSLKNANVMRSHLHELDLRSPLLPNATRWLSWFNTLDSFIVLYQLVLPLTLVDCEKPSPDVFNKVLVLKEKLDRIHSTMIHAQSDSDNNDMAMIRALFDRLIKDFPEFETYIGANAEIIYDKNFETGICKVQNFQESTLTDAETSSLVCFEKPTDAPHRNRRVSTLNVQEFIEEETKKRKRLENSQSGTKYVCTKHAIPHSCMVERLFSRAKLIFTDHRRRMYPRNLELALYLHEHRSFWSISTVQDCIVVRRNAAAAARAAPAVPVVEQVTQPMPTVENLIDSDSENDN